MPAGPNSANHDTAVIAGQPLSATVGMSGSSAIRFGAPSAIIFTAPAFTCGIALPIADEHHRDMAGDHILHRRRRALVMHGDELRAGHGPNISMFRWPLEPTP